MRVDLFGCRDCKCSIFCYIRLVIMFKDYCFIRKTSNNSLIIICFRVEITIKFTCNLCLFLFSFFERRHTLRRILHETSISILFHFC